MTLNRKARGAPVPRILVWSALLAIASAPGGSIGAAAPQEIEFRFNPPDGTTFVETALITQSMDLRPGGREIATLETKARYVITKRPGGYAASITILSYTSIEGGRRARGLIQSLFEGLILTYELDDNGRALSIKGFDVIVDRLQPLLKEIRETLSPDELRTLSPFLESLTEERLVSQAKDEWDARMEFSGRRLKIGEVIRSTRQVPMPAGGMVTLYTAASVGRQAACGNRGCVLVRTYSHSNVRTLSGYIGKPPEEVMKAINDALPKPRAGASEAAGVAELLIDPATMLPYGEASVTMAKLQLHVPRFGRMEGTFYVTTESRYTYGR